jgi:UDP-N-acetylmuramoyl-L-alanyl-D-glutamate--2,6-diaminopimelate ligase
VNPGQSRSLHTLLARWGRAVEGTSLPQPPEYSGYDVLIRDIVEHSDRVNPGSCFVARVRTGTDGHPYIKKAIARGATLIVGERDPKELELDQREVAYLQTDDSAVAEAWLSAAFYNFPSRDLIMVGVTGTDGKTTTTNLIFHILRSAGVSAGMLSTIKANLGDSEEALGLHVTTPEAPVIQRYLRRMVDAGITHCVLETTSHSLAQHRVDAVDFDVAAVTNITHEHLDYHGDFEGYFSAKARLFQFLAPPRWNLPRANSNKDNIIKTAVLNADDGSYDELAKIPVARRISYGIGGDGDIQARQIRYSIDATSFKLQLNSEASKGDFVESPLFGEFNVYNLLAAAGVVHALGYEADDISHGLDSVDVLSGRMERIDSGQEFLVVVDFAHTPNGIEKAINAARDIADGRVITVFGSAGKRDVSKRTLMSEISSRDADFTVLTAEDPRTESLDEILSMMADGCRNAGGDEGVDFWIIQDRGQAIYFALTLAQPADIVLICGKGHEQSMCFGTIEYPWDDRQATREALAAFLENRPMGDLGLPTFEDS